jgi:predicted O-methyltransferase YrrM
VQREQAPTVTWRGGEIEVDGVRFAIESYADEPDGDRFAICKPAKMLTRYLELMAEFHHPRIVEIGVLHGGSVALLSLLTDPSGLVALELSTKPLPRLERFIEARGLTDRVKPHFGVDQGDRDAVAAIVERELGPEPLDLVIDDASHEYQPTKASFEYLYPRLRPGGLYLIEDWNARERMANGMQAVLDDARSDRRDNLEERLATAMQARDPEIRREPPISRLAHELTILRAEQEGVVERVTIERDWIVVRRGEAALDPATFRIDDLIFDYFDTLRPR